MDYSITFAKNLGRLIDENNSTCELEDLKTLFVKTQDNSAILTKLYQKEIEKGYVFGGKYFKLLDFETGEELESFEENPNSELIRFLGNCQPYNLAQISSFTSPSRFKDFGDSIRPTLITRVEGNIHFPIAVYVNRLERIMWQI